MRMGRARVANSMPRFVSASATGTATGFSPPSPDLGGEGAARMDRAGPTPAGAGQAAPAAHGAAGAAGEQAAEARPRRAAHRRSAARPEGARPRHAGPRLGGDHVDVSGHLAV